MLKSSEYKRDDKSGAGATFDLSFPAAWERKCCLDSPDSSHAAGCRTHAVVMEDV